MPHLQGLRFGNYRLMGPLGSGGCGEVYLAEHLYLKNYKAIKILHTSLNERDEQLFLTEAQTLAQLMHPNIVRVHDWGIEHATPFLVMDYATGGTLRQRYPKGSCLSLDLVVSYTKQIAAALQYAHDHFIVHRDVKPENIFQGPEQVMLGDFGISVSLPSANTHSIQEWAGTLGYIAPEQLQGKAVFASDQYSLAILVYEWLCGCLPFGENYAYQHTYVPPPRLREKDPSLPDAVEVVVLKALSKCPTDRYVSVRQFAQVLELASQESLRDQQSDTSQTYSPDAPPASVPRRVFLSHTPANDVTQLKADLNVRDVIVADSVPLQDEESVRQAVRAAQVVLLVLSPQARSSPVIKEQLRIADLYRRPILCIWVAGNERDEVVPIGAEAATVIDARGQHYNSALYDVLHFLERERVGTTRAEFIPPESALEPRNPYKGLHAFKQNDRADFFGREALVLEMVEKMRNMLLPMPPGAPGQRLLAVVGSSGSGKSSTLLAGLLPRLQDGALKMSETWCYLDPVVPGKQPVDSLARALVPCVSGKSVEAVRKLLDEEGGFGLHQLALSLAHQGTHIVVPINQFEDVFSLDVSEHERRQFIDLLVTAATEPRGPVLILLTLRADVFGRPLDYPALGRLIQQHQCVVLPMDAQNLRAAIERPALASDVKLIFEDDLIGDLLFELRGQSGTLPILEFTLEKLFHHRRGHRLTRRAYEEIGGVRGALSKHAESVYTTLPSEEHRRLTRAALFARLIQANGIGQDLICRRATLAELSLDDPNQSRLLKEAMDAFREAGLLVINGTVEVSHEALLREWARLANWLPEYRSDLPLQEAISRDAAEWKEHGKPRVDDVLYMDARLAKAQAWEQRNVPSRDEAAFLRASEYYHRQQVVVSAIEKLNFFLQWSFLSLVEPLLLLRVIFKFFGSDPIHEDFVKLTYSLSNILLSPLSAFLRWPITIQQTVDWPTLIAVAIYFLIFLAMRRLLRILSSNPIV